MTGGPTDASGFDVVAVDFDYQMGESPFALDDCDDDVTGTVVHEDGTPAPRALVVVGGNRRRANERGEFRVCVPEWGRPDEIWAFERGRLPGRAPLAPHLPSALANLLPKPEGPEKRPAMRLQLGGPTLSIRGRLVDAQHRPLAGWSVGLKDATILDFDTSGPPWTYAEDLARPAPGQWLVTTDAAGRFEYGGLLDDSYCFLAYDPVSFQKGESAPVRAGSLDAQVMVPLQDIVPIVRGRVLGLDGTPLPRARVTLRLSVFASRTCVRIWQRDPVETTVDGAFELHDVPPANGELWVEGDGIVTRPFSIRDFDLDTKLRLNVQRECAIHVEGLPAGTEPMRLFAMTDWDMDRTYSWIDADGRRQRGESVVPAAGTLDLVVPEEVRKLRLVGGTRERVEERSVQPKPGERTVLRW